MAANIIDLTTVAAVNAILNQGSTVDSGIIQTEITAYSQNILTRTGRGFLSGVRAYSERYNGNGSTELPVRNYPILSIQGVQVGGIAIPASPDYIQSGYAIDTEGSICNICIVGANYGLGVLGGQDQSHENAPVRHEYTTARATMATKASTSTSTCQPCIDRKTTATGKR